MIRPRALLASGLALVTLAGTLHAALRLTYGERTAYVHVRWRPAVDPAARNDVERAHGLIPVDFHGDRTWGYLLGDLSRDNIRSLVHHDAVEDTHYIERGEARIASTAPRGDYQTDRPAWIARGLELLRGALLIVGALVFALGTFSAWRYARAHTADSSPRSSTLQFADRGLRTASTLLFGGGIAAIVVFIGTRDLESFETAFFSLDRGTAAAVVRVLWQPVYTLAVGLGVRLPLHGSLGASPAAALAPYLPAPVTYWLLLAFAIAASALIVRHALQPVCGRLLSWLALVLLFCSVPTVNYTLFDDWPETAVTYCAFIACVFAPHAVLASLAARGSLAARRIAALAVAATLWSLVALSHPGYWPLLGATLGLTSALALFRPQEPFRRKVVAFAGLGVVSLLAVVPQAPDIIRELTGGGSVDTRQMQRLVDGPTGSLLHANAFPFEPPGDARLPFTYLALSLVSLVIGLTSDDRCLRRLAVGAALLAVTFGIGATGLLPGAWRYAPSNTWALRDPAIAFAVFSGAAAATAVRRSRTVHATIGARLAIAALLLGALQGLAYAGQLVRIEFREAGQRTPWTHELTRPEDRLKQGGLAPDRFPVGARFAFWPGLRDQMRNRHRPSVDFADAGYLVATASTKDRTMAGLVGYENNEFLFNQTTDLPPSVLCDPDAIRFLQLRYLLATPGTACPPWKPLRDVWVDGWMEVSIAGESDHRVSALPLSRAAGPLVHHPAFSVDSSLLADLVPLPGTSVDLTPPSVTIELDDPSRADGHALVLPLAYDPALRASSGRIHNVGGLAALVGVDERRVRVEFVPDVIAVLRAISMTLAQVLAVLGFVGMARVSWAGSDEASPPIRAWARGVVSRGARALQPLLERPNWLYLAYGIAVVSSGNIAGALLPLTVVIVIRLARRMSWYRWIAGMLFAAALVRVAAAGSRAASAVHDPLFWSLAAAITFTMSAVIRRWPVAAATASFCAGALTVLATLLLSSPDVQSMFSGVDVDTIGRSFVGLSDRLGVLAATLLLGLWLQGIWPRGRSGWKLERTEAAVRGALLAGLMLTLAGAVPAMGTEGAWIAALGVLLGLAETRARNPDTR